MTSCDIQFNVHSKVHKRRVFQKLMFVGENNAPIISDITQKIESTYKERQLFHLRKWNQKVQKSLFTQGTIYLYMDVTEASIKIISRSIYSKLLMVLILNL